MTEIMVKPASPATGLGYACCGLARYNKEQSREPRHYTSEGQPTDPGVCPSDRGTLVNQATRTDH
jgi:hypothetical protein